MSSVAALTAWLSAPTDTSRQQALVVASRGQPIDLGRVDRLPAAGLAAWMVGDVPRLTGVPTVVRHALLVCGLAQRAELKVNAADTTSLAQMPFIVRIHGDEVIIELPSTCERSQVFSDPFYHQWIGGIAASRAIIDCSRINHVHSVLIAWMLQLAQAAKPTSMRIRGAKAVVATQLRQLRLDHLMPIE